MGLSDTLRYKPHTMKQAAPKMRHIYKVMASQYDPLGFILPFTTWAKVIIHRLGDKIRDWHDSMLPEELSNAWSEWER